MSNGLRTAILAGMGIALPGFAAAAQAAATGDAAAADVVLEEVIVVAKRRTPLQHVAATVTVIDQAHIARTLTGDIRDLVRYEPGIAVRNDPVRFGIDSFAIRGIGGDRVVAEIDGIAVAESFAVGALADSGRIFTDMDFIERLEILRGPASALYGSDAIGGVVHFQTIDPRNVLGPDAAFTSRLRAGYRSVTDGWSATALNAWSAGAVELLLGYAHREDNAADIAGGTEPNPRDSRSDQVLAKLVLPDIAPGPMEIAIEAGRARDATIVNALLGTPPRFVNTTAMSGDDTAEHLRIGIEQTLAVGSRWMDDATWRLNAQRTDTRQITAERRRAVPPRTPPAELERTFSFKDELAGLELIASKRLDTGSWSHQFVYGIDIDVGRVTEERDGYERNLNTGTVSNVILGEAFPVRDFPVTERIEAGAYLQDELRKADSRWRFTPGVRFDLYRLRPREDATYREDNPSARPVKLAEQSVAPKLAVACEISDRSTAFAQYARGFRSPPFEDVNIGLEIPLFNYRALPNPDLKPETSDGYEIGLRHRDTAWQMTLSAHYTEFEDFIESRVNLGRDPVTGVTLFQSRNLEHARIFGIEMTGRVDIGALASPMQGWSVGLNAAWTRGDNTVTDQPLNAIEPLKANLTIDYDAANGWGARVIATAVASKDRVADGAAPLYRADGYLRFDAFAYLALGERGRINLGVSNLADERYTEWSDVRGRAADDPLLPYFVQPGRNASVSFGWTF